MRGRALVVMLVAVAIALVCARMSLWQLSRWQARRAQATTLREALSRPAVVLPDSMAAWPALAGRRVRVRGDLDRRWRLLLSDRWRGDSAGVEACAPLRLPGGVSVLADLGWMPSHDGVHARTDDWPAPGGRALLALLEPLPARARATRWEQLADAGVPLWSARALGADSLAAHAPCTLAPWVLRALTEPGAPAEGEVPAEGAVPAPQVPEAPEAGMNLSYAIQWALFALAFLAGGVLVARRGSRETGPPGR